MAYEHPPARSVRFEARAHVNALENLLAKASEGERERIFGYLEKLLSLDLDFADNPDEDLGGPAFKPPEPDVAVPHPFQLPRGPRWWPEEAPERPAAIRDEIIMKVGVAGGAVSTTSILNYLVSRGLSIERAALATVLHRMTREAKSMGNVVFLTPAARGCFSLAPDGRRRFDQLRQNTL